MFDLEPITTPIYLFYQNRKSYAEDVLLDGSNGIKVFHRRLRQNTVALQNEFDLRLKNIFKYLSLEDQKFVTEKLEFGYEPSLRRRIKELLAEIDTDILSILFTGKKERKEFIDNVVNTRNYLVHHSELLKSKASKGVMLYHLSKKVNIFLILIVLKEIGFTKEELKKALSSINYLNKDYYL